MVAVGRILERGRERAAPGQEQSHCRKARHLVRHSTCAPPTRPIVFISCGNRKRPRPGLGENAPKAGGGGTRQCRSARPKRFAGQFDWPDRGFQDQISANAIENRRRPEDVFRSPHHSAAAAAVAFAARPEPRDRRSDSFVTASPVHGGYDDEFFRLRRVSVADRPVFSVRFLYIYFFFPISSFATANAHRRARDRDCGRHYRDDSPPVRF